jgi:hypothetical protein
MRPLFSFGQVSVSRSKTNTAPGDTGRMMAESDPHSAPVSEEALDAFVRAFEAGTLPKSRWTHEGHLVAGAHYVFLLGEAGAMDRMRQRVRAHNEAVGTANTAASGYHETLTRMWIGVLTHLLRAWPGSSRLSFVQLAVERLGPRRNLHILLYDFDVVKDPRARAQWLEPTGQLPDYFFR